MDITELFLILSYTLILITSKYITIICGQSIIYMQAGWEGEGALEFS